MNHSASQYHQMLTTVWGKKLSNIMHKINKYLFGGGYGAQK
jgi:hypothetical protein